MTGTSSLGQTRKRSDSIEYLRNVHKSPYDRNYHKLTFPIFANDLVENYMSSASGTRAINEAVTHHLTRVTAKTMRDANATHETWMDWAPAHDDQSGVIISLTSASGADQVITRILFRQEADPVLTGSFDEEEAPSVTISKILQFEPGTQQAISLFPEQWEEAAGSILDTLAAGGFDVPFTDCEKFTGHVELKCGDRNTTDLSIRIKLPNRKLCWTYASGTLHESSP